MADAAAAIQPLDPSQFEQIGDPSGSASQGQPANVQQAQQGSAQAVGSVAQLQQPQQVPASLTPNAPAPQPSASGAQATGQPLQPLDAAQFDPIPPHSNGISPSTPINSSPLDADERFKVAGMDEKTKDEYLRSKFEDVQQDKDGNYLLKKDGLWHSANPSTFQDVDAWQATKGVLRAGGSLALLGIAPDSAKALADGNPVSKEILGSYADHIRGMTVAAVGALGAEVAAPYAAVAKFMGAGGTAVSMQAVSAGLSAMAAKGIFTSMGRLDGTYNATPEQQVGDAAYEGLLNAGGVYIGAGLKVGAEFAGDMMPQWAKNMANLPSAARQAFKNIYGDLALGSGGGQHIDEVLENTGAVRELMGIGANAGEGKFEQAVFEDKAATIRKAEQTGSNMLTALWSKFKGQLQGAVPANFVADMSEVANPIFQKLADNGLVEMQLASGERKAAADAAEMIANKSSLMKGAKWVVRKPEDLLEVFRSGGVDVADAALSKDTHEALSQFVKTLGDVSGAKAYGREAGVNMLMKSSQALDDLTYQLQQQGKESGVNAIERMMSDMHGQVRAGITAQFDKSGAGQAFTALNESYSSMRQPMQMLQKAVAKADRDGNDRALEALMNQLSMKSGNQAQKSAFNQIAATADKYGLSQLSKDFSSQQARLRAADAAKAFNPMLNPKMSLGAGLGTVGAMAAGHPGVAAGFAAGAVATSPRVAYMNTLIAKGLIQSKNMLAAMGGPGVSRLANNPQAMAMFTKSLANLPMVHDAVQQQLMQPAMQMLQQGQQGQGGGR